MESNVRVQLGDDRVATVEVLRGPNNYFDIALLEDIADALESLATGPSRAVVLCSEGRHFCAGAQLGGPKDEDPDAPHLYDMALRIFEAPLPVVAAVQGAAIGGGLGLAMAADFRVASEKAWFTANFSRLGFHHGFALSATLPWVVGHRVATNLLYTGRRVGAEEAAALGLVDEVVPPGREREAAHARALEIAEAAPLAVRSIRETMRADLMERVRAAFVRERSEQDRLVQTSDFTEGVAAVAERRSPIFTGA